MIAWDLESNEELPPAGEREEIVDLRVAYDAGILWEELAGLPALQRLRISGPGIFELSVLPVLPGLRELIIDNSDELEDASALERQPALECLELNSGVNLAWLERLDFPTLAGLTGLRRLGLSWQSLDDLSFLAGMTKLEALSLPGCEAVRDLRPVVHCTSLRDLGLGGCDGITDLDVLAELPSLRSLSLTGSVCAELSALAGTSLQTLHLSYQRTRDLVVDLASIARIPDLIKLGISGATFVDLSELAGSPVRELSISGCDRLTDLSAVGALPRLERLWVSEVRGLSHVDLGAPGGALREVFFRACYALADLDHLRRTHPDLAITWRRSGG